MEDAAASGWQLARIDRRPMIRTAKRFGFSDRQLATMFGISRNRKSASSASAAASWPTFKSVDTCAAEFEAYTPYYYSTYEDEDEDAGRKQARPTRKRIMILGGGPNRIGQGIEFDYCCCHASFALRELGIESIMVNSQPGDGQHRLRHERPAVLRAAHRRRRAEHLRSRPAGRRDRAVRRTDAAESGPGA